MFDLYGDDPADIEGHGAYEGEPPVDTDRVNWHMRKAAEVQAEIDDCEAVFEAEIARLQKRRDSALKTLLDRRQWHAEAVEAWHRRAYAAGRVTKTVHLPHGTSELRSPPAAFEVLDEDAFRGWAAMNDLEERLWIPKPAPLSKRAAKELLPPAEGKGEAGSHIDAVFPETGEPVPGVEYRQARNRHNLRGAE